MNKTLLDISQTKNGSLSEVLVNWKKYDEEEVIFSFSELKRRDVINPQLQGFISEFAEDKGKTFPEIESEFFKNMGAENYSEYYNSNINILEKSDEEKLEADKLKRQEEAALQKKIKKKSDRNVFFGSLWLLGGLIALWLSITMGGGRMIGFGAVFLGATKLLIGLTKSY